jgi:uncharacterized membrane protein
MGAASLLAPLCAVVATTTAVVVGTATAASAAGTYSITGWGALTPVHGAPQSYTPGVGGNVLAGNGDAVGESLYDIGPTLEAVHGVLFKGGVLTDIGTLNPGDQSAATSVNNSDTVVGTDNTIVGNQYGPNVPIEWSNGKLTRLGGGLFGEPFAINDHGTIVGALTQTTNSGPRYAEAVQFNSDGSVTNLGKIPGSAESPQVVAIGINNAGQIVGAATDSSAHVVAVTFSGGSATALPSLSGFDLNVAGGISDVNGDIVGTASNLGVPGSSEAVQYGPGAAAIDLGHLPGDVGSGAQAVNSSGVAVGLSIDPSNHGRAAMFSGGQVTDLNTLLPANSGWTLQSASGINDSGVIVGSGTHNGTPEAFTLTPPPRQFFLLSPFLSGIPVIGPILAGLLLQLDGLLKLNL